MRRAGITAAAIVVALAAGCGGDGDDLESYIEQANAVQQRAAPALERANEAFAGFAAGEIAPAEAPERLAAAERAIRKTRAEVAALEPPAIAATLHRELLRYLDLHAALAGETTSLARYLPAADAALRDLPADGRRLTRRLETADSPGEQARALNRYRRGLGRAVEGLAGLDPPPLVAANHRERLAGLRSLRSLALGLERAIRARDGGRVARLLLRFRRERATTAAPPALDERSLRDYRRRHDRARRQVAAVRREETRLQRELIDRG